MNEIAYTSDLAEYIHRTYQTAKKERARVLEDKWNSNFEAVTNQDTLRKRWKQGEGDDWRDDTYIGKIRAKVWTLYAVFLDTVMLGGQIPFTLHPSPYGDLESDEQVEETIEGMSDRIKEQLRDRHADREYMKKWLSMGYYGEAWSKYDVDKVTRRTFRRVNHAEGQVFSQFSDTAEYQDYQAEEVSESVPGWRYTSVWDLFWDMEEWDPQDMAYVFHRIPSCVYDLRQLEGEGYIPEAIKQVIEEHKGKRGQDDDESSHKPGLRLLGEKKKSLERFEFHMRVPVELAEGFEKNVPEVNDISEVEEEGNEVHVLGEMVEGEIIRYFRNGAGWKPFLRCPLEIDLDGVAARGVPDNMDDVQRFLNGSLRAFSDNKRITANAMMAIKRRYFEKPGQLAETRPGMQFDINDECDDVRKAIMPVVLPDVGETLISAIQMAEKWCDDVSLIPTFMQGFNLPKHKADTAYELSQMQQNAGKYIGQAIRNNDEYFIEPEITTMYEYNMADPEFQPKGNFKVHAGGFNSFQSRIMKVEEIKSILALVISSEFLLKEVKLRPHLEVLYKVADEDPDDFLKSEEDKAMEAQQEQEALEAARQAEEEAFQRKVQMEIEKEKAKFQGALEKENVDSGNNMNEATHQAGIDSQLAEEDFQRQVILGELNASRNEDSRGTAQGDKDSQG